MDIGYAAAEITFINRDNNEQKAYTYPVTKVVLRERDIPDNRKVFIVNSDGKWIEVK